MATTTRSEQPRETAVPCRRCRKTATFDLDRLCGGCAGATVPFDDGTDGSYFSFDLDTQHVEIPEFRRSREAVMAELLAALAPTH